MTAARNVLFSLALGLALMESAFCQIRGKDWLAVSTDLNRILDAIDANPTTKKLVGTSYTLNSGTSTFEELARGYRHQCGTPMEIYAREHNITSEGVCVWDFLREASQDSAFLFGIPFDREIFSDCGFWLTEDGNDGHFIIGMWAIYENKGEIINKIGSDDCENARI